MNADPNEQQHPFPAIPPQVAAPLPTNGQFDFQALVQSYWNVLTHPSVATFDAELPATSQQRMFIGAGIVAVALALLQTIINWQLTGGPNVLGFLFYAIVGFGAFFFAVAVYQFIAKRFGGTASFQTYAYALTLANAPIFVLEAIAALIPLLGLLLIAGLGLYGLYLAVLATKSVHRLDTGKAVAVVLIPAGVAVVLSCALYGALIAVLLAAFAGAH